MRDVFPEYYRPSGDALNELWQNAIFVLDANVLLSLYRLPQQGREDLFKALEAIGGRLWMPYHAALEYQRNRLNVIADQKSVLSAIRDHIDKTFEAFRSGLGSHKIIQAEEVLNPVAKALDEYKAKLDVLQKKQTDVHEADDIRDRVDALLGNKIGKTPTQEEIDAINLEGDTRFSAGIPPGFKDAKKEGAFFGQGVRYQEKFGDLYVWKQTLAQVREKSIASVIFVTNDTKVDWWLEVRGKTIGPLPELHAECLAAGAKYFHMYNVAQFLDVARKSLDVQISEKSVEQAVELEDRPTVLANGKVGHAAYVLTFADHVTQTEIGLAATIANGIVRKLAGNDSWAAANGNRGVTIFLIPDVPQPIIDHLETVLANIPSVLEVLPRGMLARPLPTGVTPSSLYVHLVRKTDIFMVEPEVRRIANKYMGIGVPLERSNLEIRIPIDRGVSHDVLYAMANEIRTIAGVVDVSFQRREGQGLFW